jgi:ribosomal protein S18 acetylase RimI-like enzyme
LFTQAFKEHPLIPAIGAKSEATRPVMNAFIDFFGGTESSLLYGIRKDNKLACASVSLDSTVKPSKPALIGFVFSLAQAVGWRITREFEAVVREEPKYEGRYLELVVFGTLPAYQRQGLGRKMLNFLYNEAKREGYKGVILVADRNSPAFNLYLKEGFSVDRVFIMGGATLCWMRLVF